jgi:hypothetical protein
MCHHVVYSHLIPNSYLIRHVPVHAIFLFIREAGVAGAGRAVQRCPRRQLQAMVEGGADGAAAVRVRIVGSRALRTFNSPWP